MSKRKWLHPEVPVEELKSSFRSVGELEDTAELRAWAGREFPSALETMSDEDDQENTRRDFMKVMGASAALAGFGLAACRRPEAHIVPFSKAPEWVIPGKALYYASAMPAAGGATPLMVTTYEGRPTLVAPNKLHPEADGTDSMVAASPLNLYDPARSRNFLVKGEKVERAKALELLADLTSKKTAIVFGEDVSPTRDRLVAGLKLAGAYQYEALAGAGQKAALAAAFKPGAALSHNYAKANRILSVDADFLETDKQGPVKGFYKGRSLADESGDESHAVQKAAKMNRLYVAEPAYTLTGGMADHRAPLAPSQVASFLSAVAAELGVSGYTNNLTGDQSTWVKACAADLKSHDGLVVLGSRYEKELHDLALIINKTLGALGKSAKILDTGVTYGSIENLAADIQSGKVETVLFATPGNPVYENPVINGVTLRDLLAKVKVVQLGEKVDATANAADLHIPSAHYLESWSDTRSAKGIYSVVQPMIMPLYGGVSEVELLLALSGDVTSLYNSLTDETNVSPAYEAVRATFEKVAGAKYSKAALKQLLREGFWSDKYAKLSGPKVSAPKLASAKAPAKGAYDIVFATDASILDGRYINNSWLQEAPDPITKLTWDNCVQVSPQTAKDLGLYDEIVELEKEEQAWWGKLGIDKDSKYKTTSVSQDKEGPSLAAPMLRVSSGSKSLELPVVIGFGQADNTLVVSLGYGQGYDEHWVDEFKGGLPAGYEGTDINICDVSSVSVNRGFDAYPLRDGADYFVSGVSAAKVDGLRYKMARTQEHHSMYGRALAREISAQPVDKYGHKEDFAHQLEKVQKHGMDSHAPENNTLYKQQDLEGKSHLSDKVHQWAMAIDLSSCTGCNACLVACQAENNIPVVGKTQVAMGREMHWIRMDRYFAEAPKSDYGDKKAEKKHDSDSLWASPLEMIPQPVACVQCESAPCETVCPVNATVHTEDGLNSMAYNRCIGTRYCANNCPYKARRFNFFDYNKRNPLIHKNLYKGPFGEKQVGEAPHLQRNPNVTVRMRGVMEKCTYCVQRLKSAKIDAKKNVKSKVLASGLPSIEVSADEKTLRVKTGAVTVACQDACSAGSITFGNLLNPDDKIRKVKSRNNELINKRGYDLLNYIGTLPRTSYLARVKNPNHAMPGGDKVGQATIHMH